jgi:acyl carrier protein
MNVIAHNSIRNFITKLLDQRGDRAPFSDREPLFSNGRLDSLAAIEIVAFMERQFSVDFVATGFDIGSIDSVTHMLTLLARQHDQREREYS